MDSTKCFRIEKDAQIPFNNKVDYCIGTGRMGLALQKEYQEQLALVQEEIGFSHIRGPWPVFRRYGHLSGVHGRKREEACGI